MSEDYFLHRHIVVEKDAIAFLEDMDSEWIFNKEGERINHKISSKNIVKQLRDMEAEKEFWKEKYLSCFSKYENLYHKWCEVNE